MEEKKKDMKEEAIKSTVGEKENNLYEDEYNISAFDDSTELEAFGTSAEKIFKTKYSVQKTNYISANGDIRDNYAVAFLTQINGVKFKNVLRVTPRKKGGNNLRDIMRLIMEVPGEHKLEIVKTTNRSDTGTNIIYSMRVSCLTDEGVPFVCPIEPVGVSDKAIWENFKRQLIARGELE